MARKSKTDKAYAPEVEFLDEYKTFIEKNKNGENESSRDEIVESFDTVLDKYERLLGDVKLLTSVGDRLQRKLKSANVMLQQQSDEIAQINTDLSKTNEELKLTIDELTRAKAGRKAQTYILFVAIVLFIISELLEEVFEDSLGQDDFWSIALSWGFKLVLVLIIKPLEGFIERRLVNSAISKEKRVVVEKHAQV